MRRKWILITIATLAMLVCVKPSVATQIVLAPGATSLPEGSVEDIQITTDAPRFSVLTATSSDLSIVRVTGEIAVTPFDVVVRAAFLRPGTATVTVKTEDGTSASVAFTVTAGPVLNPLVAETTLVQAANAGGKSLTIPFSNGGSSQLTSTFPTSVAFDISPTTIVLAPGEMQLVTFTGRTLAAGAYSVKIPLTQKRCCPVQAQTYTVTLLSLTPSGPAAGIAPDEKRIEYASPACEVSTCYFYDPKFARFTNSSSVPITGAVISDVPWIMTMAEDLVTIPANSSVEVEFAINRDLRPDSFNLLGSEVGTLSFVYASPSAGATALDTGGSTTNVSVTVVDSVTLKPKESTIPPLDTGEVALLLPGTGNVLGSVGQFVSDLSLFNRDSQRSLNNLRMFFAPAGGAPPWAAVVAQLLPSQSVRFADVTQSFGGPGHLGTMQLRFSDVDQLVAAASVFNASNPAGTYGTGIPPLRTDRAVTAGERLYLTGLRADANSHTNLYLQEAAGRGASVGIRFLDKAGSLVAERSESLDAWALRILSSVVPEGAVSAELTHTGGNGGFVAYATPVDSSGDTWVVADWSRHYGVRNAGSWVVPVAGVVHGAASSYFRTDLAIMNTGTTPASGVLRFLARDGSVIEKQIAIGSGQTLVSADVISTLFGATTDTAGFLVFVPGSGSTAMTSRTFSTKPGLSGSYGTAVPSLAPAFALESGERRQITAVEDARRSAVLNATPATFRTNFGLIETAGAAATVRVTLRYVVPGAYTAAHVVAARDFPLAANQYVQYAVRDILGPNAPDSDLHNATMEFYVVSGSGSVIPYVSSVDNGTGDSILRVD